MTDIETVTLPLDYTRTVFLGNSDIAVKHFATSLPDPIESVLHIEGEHRTWVHRPLKPRPTRRRIAIQAVRDALETAVIPFGHMHTAPHPRHVQALAYSTCGIRLTDEEIQDALKAAAS